MAPKEKNGSSNQELFPPLTLRAGHYLLELLILGLAVHLILPQLTALENSFKVISSMNIWIFMLAIVAQIASYLEYGYLLRACVAIARQELSILWGTLITLAASSIGLIAGGTLGNSAATYHWTRALGVNRQGAVQAGTLPTVFNNAILLFVAFLGGAYLLIIHELSKAQIIAFILILIFIGALIIIVLWGNTHRVQLISAVSKVFTSWKKLNGKQYTFTSSETFQRLFGSLDRLKGDGWKLPAFNSALSIGFDIMTLYLIFLAAGYKVSIGILIAGYGLPIFFGKMAFLIPGGVGVVEGSMAALYNVMGVPIPITVVVILIYRIVSFWIPSILGFPVAFYLQRLALKIKQNDELN
ncbi:MAG: lysylphosphatidylglycerol synthase transmembrane domain-containing protein [Methanomethylovorans sp.]|uniref:lysylphosphatidylglycerol synthase transmembrane domain-containing protein n=1 Tax=Methanomethylovorans sp. TaxID=2758717 RepID=UPI003C74D4B1